MPEFGEEYVWLSPLIPLTQAVKVYGGQEPSGLGWDTARDPSRVLLPSTRSWGDLLPGSLFFRGCGA